MIYNIDGDKMYLKVKKKKIEILEYSKKIDKFKSLKFVITPIDYGIKLTNKKIINTYLFCQKVDIIVTDKDNIIIAIYNDFKSEKIRIISKAHNIYYLPLNTANHFYLEEKLKEYK